MRDMIYAIHPPRIGENKRPVYGEHSQIPSTDLLQSKKTFVWIMIFLFMLVFGLSLSLVWFAFFALLLTNFNLIANRTIPQFSWECKKAASLWFLIYSNFLQKGHLELSAIAEY